MSFPNIPDISMKLDVTTDEIVNLLLASIAFEELGLANIINAEAEKIQYMLGTLNGSANKNPSVDDLVSIDTTVDGILKDVIIKEILLLFKLENVLSIASATTTTTTNATTTATTANMTGTTASTTIEG